ncbi:MAG: xanthine dehydrogenase family protein subunit M [Luteitalea sp.]|nr:xanthine dehydrogenase family protein subunit M [Luteitalea sp.]
MYSTEFDYYRAATLAEAHQLLTAHPGAKLLAGGHSLIPLLKLRIASTEAVIDIGRVAELRGLTVDGDSIRIGALTTHAELAASADVTRRAQALAEAAAVTGDPQVRNRGTIGGNIAHADPASDLPIALVALNAQILVTGPRGERAIEAAAFFTGIMSTALGENEIVTAIVVPPGQRGRGSAYVKFKHPASGYAVIGAAASVTVRDGVCASAEVAVGGLVPHVVRAPSVERALLGKPPTADTVAHAAALVADDIRDEVMGDIFASGEYRKATAAVYVKRAIAAAIERASAA